MRKETAPAATTGTAEIQKQVFSISRLASEAAVTIGIFCIELLRGVSE